MKKVRSIVIPAEFRVKKDEEENPLDVIVQEIVSYGVNPPTPEYILCFESFLKLMMSILIDY